MIRHDVRVTDLAPLPDDDVTRRLRALVARLQRELAGVAEVTSTSDGPVDGVTVSPTRLGAWSVGWIHSSEDIYLFVGGADGRELTRDLASVSLIEDVVDAVVAARTTLGVALGYKRYTVQLADGSVLEDEQTRPWAVLLEMPWRRRVKPAPTVAYRG